MDKTGKHVDVNGPLHEAVRYFYCIQTPSDFEKIDQHLSPNLEMMLVFNFGGPVRMSFGDSAYGDQELSRIGVLGPLRKMLNYEVLPNTDLIIAVFNTDGFYRLFQMPMYEMHGEKIINPDELTLNTGFGELWQALKNMSSLDDRLELLEDYAKIFLHEPDTETAALTSGIHYLHNPLIQPVRAMAMDSDVSERTIQMRFKKYLGYSTKELLRFLRFRQVINCIQKEGNNEIDWHGLIEEFGYHDQSHLIKDFRHYLGTTPRKFVRDIVGKEFCVSKQL